MSGSSFSIFLWCPCVCDIFQPAYILYPHIKKGQKKKFTSDSAPVLQPIRLHPVGLLAAIAHVGCVSRHPISWPLCCGALPSPEPRGPRGPDMGPGKTSGKTDDFCPGKTDSFFVKELRGVHNPWDIEIEAFTCLF